MIKYLMLHYILRRLMTMGPLLIGISLITFTVIHLAPGDIVDIQSDLNPKASAKSRENLRKLYGLDQPLHVQYGSWLVRLAKLDFGESFVDNRPVIKKIAERLPITVGINILSIALIFSVALPLGIISAVRQNTLFDRATTVAVFIGYSTPGFWFALLLMLLFGVHLGILPISGIQSIDTSGMNFAEKVLDIAEHLVLPIVVSVYGGIAGISRYSRTSMLEIIRQDYIRTARAKGLGQTAIILRHAFRNALLPIITIIGLMVPGIIGGSIIAETIFAIPGMGKLFYDSTMSRDYPTVMGILFIVAILTLLGNLLADISYALADPRIKVRGSSGG